jgi:rRNA-processing protein FCF1
MRYLIDTSSLIETVERHAFDRLVDDVRVSGILVLPEVFDELERLATGSGERARGARTALVLARQTLKTAQEPATQSHVDDALLEVAAAHGYGIITQDHALTARAQDRGIATLTLTRAGTIGD